MFLTLIFVMSQTVSAEDLKPGAVREITVTKYSNSYHKYKGKYYYFNYKGHPVKNKWKTINGKLYFFQSDGSAAIGLTNVRGTYYLFDSHGVRIKKVNTKPLSQLKKTLRTTMRSYPGTWSIYVKNLDTNKSICINDRSMYAASLVKLYAVATAYDRIQKCKLSESSIYDILEPMITESDNWCYNEVIHEVGIYSVNRWLKKNGYRMTNQGTGLAGAGNSYGLNNGSGDNVTSVSDCGKFMESVYRGTCVSRSASAKILNLLKHQERTWKIPAGIPSRSVVVANKTGETNSYCHDTAIVYSKGADYIICVMGNVYDEAWGEDWRISRLSSIVYRFFNS